MVTKDSKTEKSCTLQSIIGWQLLLNLLTFRDKKLKYSKDIKIGLGILLWLDVVGFVIFVWFMVEFITCI